MKDNKSFRATEDFWAILIGAFLLALALGVYFSFDPGQYADQVDQLEKTLEKEALPFKTLYWYKADDELANLKLTDRAPAAFMKKLSAKPNSWKTDPFSSFYDPPHTKELSTDEVEKAYRRAVIADRKARGMNWSNPGFNEGAELSTADWIEAKLSYEKLVKKQGGGNFSLLHTVLLFLLLLLLFGFGAARMGEKFIAFAQGFWFVFLLSLFSLFLAAQADLKSLGIEYAVWAIVIGMLISNTFGTPKWIIPALKTEFYIKSGLIVMGAEILFNKMLAIGLPGMFVAWIVTPIVLVTTFWFGQRILKIASKSLNITISADMSVCGVSAAVATAAASRASREELTVAVGLSMIFTAIMMIVMPLFVKFTGMPEVLGGAWIGGTIDSSGAVVAAGAALGDKAMYVAATIKMIQNVLIGFVAFAVAVYFATKVEPGNEHRKVGAGEIWRRFPKFILGFIGASIIFTMIYSSMDEQLARLFIDQGVLGGFTKNLRTWLFCLAFASIGLSTNFSLLKHHFTGGKPLVLYICGQTLNILLTLGMAYLMFCKVFPEVADQI